MSLARRLPLLALAFATLTAACAHPDADTSTTRTSHAQRFQVSYVPSVQPVPKRTLHAWTLQVRTLAGDPVDDATIAIDGGMPDHGHGLPTKPYVAEARGDGTYVVEGMKFNMGGYWVVDLAVRSPTFGDDDVRFELNL